MRDWYNLSTSDAAPAVDLDGRRPPDEVLMIASDEEPSGSVRASASSCSMVASGGLENDLFLASDDEAHECQLLCASSDDEGVLVETSESEVARQPPKKKRKYAARKVGANLSFLGLSVCQAAHKRLYGISSSVLQNIRAGRPSYTMHDSRVKHPTHPTLGYSMRCSKESKWQSILGFFWLLYISAAEIMPTQFAMPIDMEQGAKKDADFQDRYVNHFLNHLEEHFQLERPESLGPGSFKGPQRFLEHCSPSELFWQYIAHQNAQGQEACCLSTFMRCFKKVFGTYLPPVCSKWGVISMILVVFL